ncbi:MAG TPA: prolyl oligopeptidase family serine peptidase [Gemmatimonadaceae bacterium]|nr:prolyl oligopeptidase family serine peptidase [Gemmatimonadaceae bacterium]
MRVFRLFALLALLLAPVAGQAQKRALTQADWDIWKSISGPAISNDGKWAIYSLTPLVGDGDLVIRATSGSTEYRIPRGYLGRPNNTPGGLRPRGGNPEDEPSGSQVAPAQLTADSRYALALTYPTQAEFDRVARDRRRAAAVTGRSDLAIVRLADGNVTKIERVRSFRLPRNSGAWVAYAATDSAPADSSARPAGAVQGQQPGGRTSGPRRRYGSTIVLRNMNTGAEERLSDVLDYAFDDSAKVFAYTVVSRTPDRNGAYVRNLASGTTATLLSGRGDYSQITIDRAGSQFAFVSNREEFGKDNVRYALYYSGRDLKATPVVSSAALNDMRVAEGANVAFSRAGTALLFGIAGPPMDTLPADSLSGKAVFDLWHYKDPDLQPAQRLTAARDRNRSFQGVYHIAAKRFARLSNDSIPNVSLSDDARVGVATSRERYSISSMWGDAGNDVYLIDGVTGGAKLLREKIEGQATLSPDAKYVAMYDKGNWSAYNIATGRTVDITAPVRDVSFARETHDTPSPRPAWGIAGWTRDDRSVLVYDRYDIWELDPAGTRAPVMVTDSMGRKTKVQLRMAMGGGGFGGFGGGGATADERGLDPSKPLLLRGFNEETKSMGFVRDWLNARRQPELITVADASFGTLMKAQDAEQYLVTKGTFVDFPNLHTGSDLRSLIRISDANPQQKNYNWGTVELVSWHSADGVPLKGLLFKPENFDSTKKYPMVVYHYEQLSQNLHSYSAPTGRNIINPTHYASNGYLVFEPDIHYEEGYPGPSALKSIVPGVNALLARGFVDPKGVGIQGQSWGGYQGLYMITQSHIFSAAMLGAPVVNMTSAYGGIRWGSGLARSFQYETGQSRIGGSLWETPMRYIENSPLFWLDKVKTPVFFMHNDADDAVPWYQGIEAFVALRRLGKEVYLINYNNDVHNPASRANQKDMAMRMEQFFDHHLRGKPAPEWMKKGIPYLAKGRDQVPAGTTTPVQAGATSAPAVPQKD